VVAGCVGAAPGVGSLLLEALKFVAVDELSLQLHVVVYASDPAG